MHLDSINIDLSSMDGHVGVFMSHNRLSQSPPEVISSYPRSSVTPTKNILLKLSRMTRRDSPLWLLRIKPKSEVTKSSPEAKIKLKNDNIKLTAITSSNAIKTDICHEKSDLRSQEQIKPKSLRKCSTHEKAPTVVESQIDATSNELEQITLQKSVSSRNQIRPQIASKSSHDEAILESLRIVVRMSTKMDLSKRATATDVYTLLHEKKINFQQKSNEKNLN